MRDVRELEEKIGYHFHDKNYLLTALTHSSYANEHKGECKYNERLEFLGDSVLGVVVADYLFKHRPDLPEGDLTKIRSSLVCEKALCGYSRQMGVGDYLRLSHGEQNSGGRTRSSILADAFEAVIAAIYLDAGMEEARKFILRFVLPMLKAHKPKAFKDYKTALQELVQRQADQVLTYHMIGEAGPDHDKTFQAEVRLHWASVGTRSGHR